MRAIEQLQRNRKVRIAEYDGPDGYYIELHRGWTFDPLADNRVTVAPTVREARENVQMAQAFDGPFEDG